VGELIAIGVIAGFLAAISPCVLPVLPVILVAAARPGDLRPGGAGPDDAGQGHGQSPAAGRRARTARPFLVVLGLVLSFSLLILIGSELLSLLHLPQNALRDAGLALLILVGLGYLIPPLGLLLERPFSRLGGRRPTSAAGGFVLGLGLGLVYVPCAGPILAAITVVGATHRVGLSAVILTVAFAVGTSVPLLAFALASGEVTGRIRGLRRHATALRQAGGAVLIVFALLIGFNTLAGLQRVVPGYSTALQGSAAVRKQLNSVTGVTHAKLTSCSSTATTLINCGPAPNFAKVTAWLNTPGGKPLSLAGLRGKVVLVDFWTYSCINCQRSLPHVEAWYSRYAKDGFVVVGVHTPEFAFEHVVSNVRAQSAALGVHYPVAVDDDYGTWDAYNNEYWPADYLIDSHGDVRHIHFGEGDYSGTEQLIRQLLQAAHPGLKLPPPTSVPDTTPAGEMSPETYLGYTRLQYLLPSPVTDHDAAAVYHFPARLQLGGMAWSGTWTDRAQEATAGRGARLELSFLARQVYLVLGGHGRIDVTVNGRQVRTIEVSGVPRLYTLYQAAGPQTGKMLLTMAPGVQAYDFTFG
jgi:cytochrome c biogenesis protein CcdA/thiol-disulfide isomerase/thioredoxin